MRRLLGSLCLQAATPPRPAAAVAPSPDGQFDEVLKVEYTSLPPHHAVNPNAGKKFEYKIYEAAPGGHRSAKDSRREVYAFLDNYLHPANPAK